MTPAFGFSVGDFISAIELINKICKALDKTGGASLAYQYAIVDLHNLSNVFDLLQRLEPTTPDGAAYVNAIRGMALACHLPLRTFLVQLGKYGKSLNLFNDHSSLRAASKKVKWAVKMEEEVQRFPTLIAAKVNRERREESTHVLASLEAQVIAQNQHQSDVRAHNDNMLARVDALEGNIKAIEATALEIKSTALTLRSIGEHVSAYLRTFPTSLRQILGTIVKASLVEHSFRLDNQDNIATSPNSTLSSDIIFLDALDRKANLSYDQYRHLEVLDSFLKVQFRGLPGERQVADGAFMLLDTKRNNALIPRSEWPRLVFPGAVIQMSVVLTQVRLQAGYCPRQSCGHRFSYDPKTSTSFTCPACSLKFDVIPNTGDSVSGEDNKTTDELYQLSKRQSEDDTARFGLRHPTIDEIPDNMEIDDGNWTLPSTRDADKMALNADNLMQLRERQLVTNESEEALSVMDWHAGDTHMEAWLNQSAVPAIGAQPEVLPNQSDKTDDILRQETGDVNVLRHVHISAEEPVADIPLRDDTIYVGLSLEAQAHYRKIRDKYPALSNSLVARFAEANVYRAERLRNTVGMEEIARAVAQYSSGVTPEQKVSLHSPPPPPFTPPTYIMDSSKKPRELPPQQSIHETSKDPNCTPRDAKRKRPHVCIREHEWMSRKALNDSDHDLSMSDFWSEPHARGREIGRPPKCKRRANSVASCASSGNYSLRGSDYFDNQYQDPAFSQRPRADSTSSYDIEHASPSLFPPSLPTPPKAAPLEKPIHSWSNETFSLPSYQPRVKAETVPDFPSALASMVEPQSPDRLIECDICGEEVNVKRKRDWQNHVLEDLEPYICIATNCPTPNKTFHKYTALRGHFEALHDKETLLQNQTVTCMFCEQSLPKARRAHFKHLGRHMEDIAFALIPREYEDWTFYSEAGSVFDAIESSYSCTNHGCSQRFDSASEILRHDCDAKRGHDLPCGPGNVNDRDQFLVPYSPSPKAVPIECTRVNHTTGKPCNSVFSRPYDLLRHEDTIHNRRKYNFRCHLCTEEKTFPRHDALTRHMRFVHPDVDWPGNTKRKFIMVEEWP